MNVDCQKKGCNNHGRFEHGEYLYGYHSDDLGFVCVPCMKKLKNHLTNLWYVDSVINIDDVRAWLATDDEATTPCAVVNLLSTFK